MHNNIPVRLCAIAVLVAIVLAVTTGCTFVRIDADTAHVKTNANSINAGTFDFKEPVSSK